jgi:hypothetical protein
MPGQFGLDYYYILEEVERQWAKKYPEDIVKVYYQPTGWRTRCTSFSNNSYRVHSTAHERTQWGAAGG